MVDGTVQAASLPTLTPSGHATPTRGEMTIRLQDSGRRGSLLSTRGEGLDAARTLASAWPAESSQPANPFAFVAAETASPGPGPGLLRCQALGPPHVSRRDQHTGLKARKATPTTPRLARLSFPAAAAEYPTTIPPPSVSRPPCSQGLSPQPCFRRSLLRRPRLGLGGFLPIPGPSSSRSGPGPARRCRTLTAERRGLQGG